MALMRGGRTRTLWRTELVVAPLAAGDEQLGLLCCIARGRALTTRTRSCSAPWLTRPRWA